MSAEPHTCPTCRGPLASADAGCPTCLFQLAADVCAVERVCSPFAPPDPKLLAEWMPEFEFLEMIGRGGMGAVYKVRQGQLSRIAALKVLPPERAADPAFGQRFFREAQALAQLSHPGIVDVYDMGQRGPYLYILMEYVAGKSLRDCIHERSLSPAEGMRIAADLCAAVHHAHQQGIVHRDIKPENVLVAADGRVKLLDFGLVKLTQDSRLDRFTLTEISLRMGTPHYMAPEQVTSAGTADHRADVYALGVLLYELLTGEPPALDYTPPSRKVAADPRIDRVVQRAIRESPDERYQSAAELGRDIDCIARTPRRRALVAGVTALGVCAVLAGAFFWHRAANADPAPPPGTPIDGVPIAVVPFDAAAARGHQERWAAHLGAPVEWTNSIGMKFVLIPPGEYTRGVPESDRSWWLSEWDEQHAEPAFLAIRRSLFPAHRVRLTKAFFMAVTETTQGQYKRVMGVEAGFFRVGGAGEHRLADRDTDNLPVETLSWGSTQEFCQRLSTMEDIPADMTGYRLPTEGEWEFALRAGTTTPFWYGTEPDTAGEYEVSLHHTPLRTRPVASLGANAFGLYDMAGNVSEYCSDWWALDEYKRYANRCAVDPAGPETGEAGGYQRLVRGGTFGELSEQRSSWHSRNDPMLWQNTIGFRVVIPAETVAWMLRRDGGERP